MTHIKPLEIELPLEVYNALEELSRYNNPSTIYQALTCKLDGITNPANLTVRKYIADIECDGVQHHGQHLMQLLSGNYKIAKTPEQVLNERIEYYHEMKTLGPHHSTLKYGEYVRAMVHLCQSLDIEITAEVPLGYRMQEHPGTVSKWPMVTKDVENALRQVQRSYDVDDIYSWVIKATRDGKQVANHSVQTIVDWYGGYYAHGDKGKALMHLLIGDYGIEYTADEIVSNMIDSRQEKLRMVSRQRVKETNCYQIEALHEAANILGLEIDGITNAPFTTERAQPYTKRTDAF